MAIKKLVVEEFEVGEEPPEVAKKGYKYSYFKDPETGKFYRPKSTFEVTGENLEDLFVEVEPAK
jgi:hypothetical protein